MLKTMERIGKNRVFCLVRDCLEWYLPMLVFVLMFLDFVAGIIARYVFRSPIRWSVDVASILFLYLVGFSACYAYRTNTHVRFTLLYDILPLKLKALTAFLGNLLIFITFTISIKPSWDYIQFMKISHASSIRIYFNVIYFPYMIFLFSTLLYSLWEMAVQFLVFTGLGGSEAQEVMLAWDNKNSALAKIQEEQEGGSP